MCETGTLFEGSWWSASFSQLVCLRPDFSLFSASVRSQRVRDFSILLFIQLVIEVSPSFFFGIIVYAFPIKFDPQNCAAAKLSRTRRARHLWKFQEAPKRKAAAPANAL